MNVFCLVMAGGTGTRFWPESYSVKPKQYLNLVGDNTLLRESLLRFEGIINNSNRYIVTVKAQEKLAGISGEGEIAKDGLIFEPTGRNTAPCILLSLAKLESVGASEDDVVVIVPADHVILNRNGFKETVSRAIKVASSEEKIVTIGIRPNFPHIGYGYINRGAELESSVFGVNSFKEKPSLDVATEYVASGEFYWNAGMFVAPIKVLKEEFKKHSPDIFNWYEELKSNLADQEKLSETYSKIPAESIDYAVMEKSKNVLVTPADFDWNDLGSWDALEDVMEKTKENTLASCTGSYLKNSSGNIVFAPGKFVSLVNVKDLIVVANERAIMVLPKSDSQEVKEIVNALKKSESTSSLV